MKLLLFICIFSSASLHIEPHLSSEHQREIIVHINLQHLINKYIFLFHEIDFKLKYLRDVPVSVDAVNIFGNLHGSA